MLWMSIVYTHNKYTCTDTHTIHNNKSECNACKMWVKVKLFVSLYMNFFDTSCFFSYLSLSTTPDSYPDQRWRALQNVKFYPARQSFLEYIDGGPPVIYGLLWLFSLFSLALALSVSLILFLFLFYTQVQRIQNIEAKAKRQSVSRSIKFSVYNILYAAYC